MKLMIASDIHGSAYWCEKLLRAWERERPEKLLLLGDLLYHGPRNDLPDGYAPKEVIQLLNEKKEALLCVRGNCEAEVDQMVLEFPVLAEYALLWIEGYLFYATHGHLHGKENPPLLGTGNILVTGHTHLYAAEDMGNWYYLNPGSVSLPKEGQEHTYLLYENGTASIKELNGNTICSITFSPH